MTRTMKGNNIYIYCILNAVLLQDVKVFYLDAVTLLLIDPAVYRYFMLSE
jgi:hypothetical protein